MTHDAYARLTRGRASDGTGPRPYPPAGEPASARLRPAETAPRAVLAEPIDEPVCGRCNTWLSSCFCDADVNSMRIALRRIAELHSACRTDCPERQRLSAVQRTARSSPPPVTAGWESPAPPAGHFPTAP